MPVAIVTGASRGLGLATARALAGRGWSVVADARRAEQLQAAADGLAPGRFVPVPGDVTDPGHRAELVAAGDPETAAEAEGELVELHWLRGDAGRSAKHLGRARELVGGREPSRAKAAVICSISKSLMLSGESGEAIRLGHEALAMAEQLGLDELRAHALTTIGSARVDRGDAAGIDDLQAVEGVGENRARSVREGLSRLAESSILERYV